MQASIRVMPACYITGQAAGTAAAITVSNGGYTSDIDVHKLQKKLKNIGAFLPNFKE
jgi:hypothetical protein